MGGASSPCNFTTSVLGAQAVGNVCETFRDVHSPNRHGTVSEVMALFAVGVNDWKFDDDGHQDGRSCYNHDDDWRRNSGEPPVFVSVGNDGYVHCECCGSSGTASGTVNVTVDSGTPNGFVLDLNGNALCRWRD